MCTRCKVNLTVDKFKMKRNGNFMKHCIECNAKIKQYRTCLHGKRRTRCFICGGSEVCEHKRRYDKCKDCNLLGYIHHAVETRFNEAIGSGTKTDLNKYLGCTIEEFKQHIEKQLPKEWTWDNYGKLWNIDHITPLNYNNPTIEQVCERLHYTNTKPMLASENARKGSRYDESSKKDSQKKMAELGLTAD